MEIINCTIVIIFVCLFFYFYLTYGTRKQKKLHHSKKLEKIIESDENHDDILKPLKKSLINDTNDINNVNIDSCISEELDGIYDAPMYAPFSQNDDSNVFLLNQINQKFNDTVAYVEPDLSKI